VVEHCSGKIRGGGVLLWCTPPYFDHCPFDKKNHLILIAIKIAMI